MLIAELPEIDWCRPIALEQGSKVVPIFVHVSLVRNLTNLTVADLVPKLDCVTTEWICGLMSWSAAEDVGGGNSAVTETPRTFWGCL